MATNPIAEQAPIRIEDVLSMVQYGKYLSHLEPFNGSSAQQIILGPAAYLEANGQYNSERPVVGQIIFHNDVIAATHGPSEVDAQLDTLEFMLTLPFDVPQSKERAIFRYLNILNSLLPVGAFGVSAEGKAYYRYKWQIYQRQVSGLALLEILSQAFFYSEILGHRIEALAQGTRSLKELMHEELQITPQH